MINSVHKSNETLHKLKVQHKGSVRSGSQQIVPETNTVPMQPHPDNVDNILRKSQVGFEITPQIAMDK